MEIVDDEGEEVDVVIQFVLVPVVPKIRLIDAISGLAQIDGFVPTVYLRQQVTPCLIV